MSQRGKVQNITSGSFYLIMLSSPNYFSVLCQFQFLSLKRGIVLTDSNNVDRSIFAHLPVNYVVLGN